MSEEKKRKKVHKLVIIGGTVALLGAIAISIFVSEQKVKEANPPPVIVVKKNVSDEHTVDSNTTYDYKDRFVDQTTEEVSELRSGMETRLAELKMKLDKLEDEKKRAEATKSAEEKQKAITNREAPINLDESTAFANASALGSPKTAVPVPTTPVKSEIPKGATLTKPLPNENLTVIEKPKLDNDKTFKISLKDETKVEVPNSKKQNIRHFIPASTFVKAVLLSGVDAPTGGAAQSNPTPITMRLKGRGSLPNFRESQIKECRVQGAAYGEIASERAMIRLETITCVLLDGEVIEKPISGYVAGEDGKNGLRGKLVSKQGQLIAGTLMAGFISGASGSIAGQYQQLSQTALGQVQTLDPKRAAEDGAAKGVGNSMDKLSDWFLARANETFPIIEIDAGRIGEVVLTKGVDLGSDIEGNIQEEQE